MGAGQQFEQDDRSLARQGHLRAVKNLPLATLDISLDEMNIRETEFVERPDLDAALNGPL